MSCSVNFVLQLAFQLKDTTLEVVHLAVVVVVMNPRYDTEDGADDEKDDSE